MESATKPFTASVFLDGHAKTRQAGTRGASDALQFVLHAERFDVHAKVWGAFPEKRMAGYILARVEAFPVDRARLHLLRDGERLATTTADQLGEFRFNNVPEGQLNLQIDLPQLTVVGPLDLVSQSNL